MHLIDANTDKIYGNALNLSPGVGPARLSLILKHFGKFKAGFDATLKELIDCGIPEKIAEQIISNKLKINPLAEWEKLAKFNVKMLSIDEALYPKLLKEIPTPPPLLYVRGNENILNNLAVAVVGTRNMSQYGSLACEEITNGLCQSGVTVVSGMAFGVDTLALTCCAKLNNPAIAVLATPLDDGSITPVNNIKLAKKIMDRGCLVSEYPLGAVVGKQNFPARNRIISGLTLGTVVIEAAKKSGALITAKYALDQNREVFAVPGSIFSENSFGTHELIKQGAILTESASDILSALNLDAQAMENIVPNTNLNDLEQTLLAVLDRNPKHIDEIARNVKINMAKVIATMTMLEIKSRVKTTGNGNYVKIY